MRMNSLGPIGLAVGAVATLALALTPPALGWTDPDPSPVAFSRFAPEARLSADGRHMVVSGTAICEVAEGVVQVAVSILQDATLAAVRGRSFETPCALGVNDFTAELTVREGAPSFAAGPVQACALAQTRVQPDAAADYDMWCVFVTLVVDPAM